MLDRRCTEEGTKEPMALEKQAQAAQVVETERTTPKSSKTNITLKLDKDLLRRVRVLAAEKGISVSALLAAKLEEELSRRTEYEEARKRWESIVAKGMNLGGVPLSREEMHER
jgi:hypothetical protein